MVSIVKIVTIVMVTGGYRSNDGYNCENGTIIMVVTNVSVVTILTVGMIVTKKSKPKLEKLISKL